MKRLFIAACLLFLACFSMAQTTPYNVVFDLTSKDTNDHKTVMRWLTGISRERPDAQLEVVLYGQSLDMIRKDRSVVAPALEQLMQANKNITVKVCAASMKRHNVQADELVAGVGMVDDGIYQIITRQKQGWGYIKAAH